MLIDDPLNSFFALLSATSGGILDRAVAAEDRKHGDILRLVIILCSFLSSNVINIHI